VVTIGESGETGRAEMVSCLLDWRANPELRGMDKEFKACDNALGWAQRNGYVKVLRTIGMHMLRRDASNVVQEAPKMPSNVVPTYESSAFMTSFAL